MIRALASLPSALIRPDRVFAGREIYRLSKVFLILSLFSVYITGERLVQGFYQNEHAKTLAMLEVETRMGGLLQNAPTEVQDQMRGRLVDSVLGSQSGTMTAVSIVASGCGFLLVLLEVWLVSMVASQFFGGQEERHGRGRPSWTLYLVAFVPLALRKLCAGIVMLFRSPEAAANALTLTDYRALSAARFDFFSLLPLGQVNAFLAAIARMVTDPFFLWTLVIICFGGREVFRFSLKSAALLSLVLVVVLGLQAALFARIGFVWEM